MTNPLLATWSTPFGLAPFSEISDDDFDHMLSTSDLKAILIKLGFTGDFSAILALPMMKKVKACVDPCHLENYSIAELARLAYPEVQPG